MTLDEKLKSEGLSVTKSRQAIFDVLNQSPEPISIQELDRRLPGVDRSTIYRTADLFENLGVLKRVWFGFKNKLELSDQFQAHHHHIICEECGRVTKIDNPELEVILKKLTSQQGYMHTKHHVELFGTCLEHST